MSHRKSCRILSWRAPVQTTIAALLTLLLGVGIQAYLKAQSTPGGQQTPKNMVFVQGGEFQMGNDKGYLMERPAHAVTVSDFYIDKFEITVAQYRELCKATKRKMPSPPPWGWQDNHPIVKVTWEDAKTYAAWAGKRLPTEAEWEYAARGGNRREMYRYSGSDEVDNVAWYANNSGQKTHPVGTKSPNALGSYDMTGNAAEWCADWYNGNYYRMSPSQDPPGPSVGTDRVIRGGSFLGDQDECRVTKRSSALPNRVSSSQRFSMRLAAEGEVTHGLQ